MMYIDDDIHLISSVNTKYTTRWTTYSNPRKPTRERWSTYVERQQTWSVAKILHGEDSRKSTYILSENVTVWSWVQETLKYKLVVWFLLKATRKAVNETRELLRIYRKRRWHNMHCEVKIKGGKNITTNSIALRSRINLGHTKTTTNRRQMC